MRLSELPTIPTARSCACQNHAGMGLLDNMNPWVKYALIGSGALLVLSLLGRPGSAKYKRELADARDEYENRVRSIARKYPRVGSRLRRAASAF